MRVDSGRNNWTSHFARPFSLENTRNQRSLDAIVISESEKGGPVRNVDGLPFKMFARVPAQAFGGASLYLDTLLRSSIILLICFVIRLPSMIIFSRGEALPAYIPSAIGFQRITIGNLVSDTTAPGDTVRINSNWDPNRTSLAAGIAVEDVIGSLILIGLLFLSYRRFKPRLENDEECISIDRYTVQVENLLRGVTAEDVRKIFESRDRKIVDVVLAEKPHLYFEYVQRKEKIVEELKEIMWRAKPSVGVEMEQKSEVLVDVLGNETTVATSHRMFSELPDAMDRLRHELAFIDHRLSELKSSLGTLAAFVTFEDTSTQLAVLDTKGITKVSPAPPPDRVDWGNFEFKKFQRIKRGVVSAAIIFFILTAHWLLLIAISVSGLDQNTISAAEGSSAATLRKALVVISALICTVLNGLLAIVTPYLLQRSRGRVKFSPAEIMCCVAAVQFFNTALLPLLVNTQIQKFRERLTSGSGRGRGHFFLFDGEFLEMGSSWMAHVGGMITLTAFFHIALAFVPFIQLYLSHSSVERSLWFARFSLGQKYGIILAVILVAVMYSGPMPILDFVGGIILGILYVCDRCVLLRVTRPPLPKDEGVCRAFHIAAASATVFHACISLWSFSANLPFVATVSNSDPQNFGARITCVAALPSLIFLAAAVVIFFVSLAKYFSSSQSPATLPPFSIAISSEKWRGPTTYRISEFNDSDIPAGNNSASKHLYQGSAWSLGPEREETFQYSSNVTQLASAGVFTDPPPQPSHSAADSFSDIPRGETVGNFIGNTPTRDPPFLVQSNAADWGEDEKEIMIHSIPTAAPSSPTDRQHPPSPVAPPAPAVQDQPKEKLAWFSSDQKSGQPSQFLPRPAPRAPSNTPLKIPPASTHTPLRNIPPTETTTPSLLLPPHHASSDFQRTPARSVTRSLQPNSNLPQNSNTPPTHIITPSRPVAPPPQPQQQQQPQIRRSAAPPQPNGAVPDPADLANMWLSQAMNSARSPDPRSPQEAETAEDDDIKITWMDADEGVRHKVDRFDGRVEYASSTETSGISSTETSRYDDSSPSVSPKNPPSRPGAPPSNPNPISPNFRQPLSPQTDRRNGVPAQRNAPTQLTGSRRNAPPPQGGPWTDTRIVGGRLQNQPLQNEHLQNENPTNHLSRFERISRGEEPDYALPSHRAHDAPASRVPLRNPADSLRNPTDSTGILMDNLLVSPSPQPRQPLHNPSITPHTPLRNLVTPRPSASPIFNGRGQSGNDSNLISPMPYLPPRSTTGTGGEIRTGPRPPTAASSSSSLPSSTPQSSSSLLPPSASPAPNPSSLHFPRAHKASPQIRTNPDPNPGEGPGVLVDSLLLNGNPLGPTPIPETPLPSARKLLTFLPPTPVESTPNPLKKKKGGVRWDTQLTETKTYTVGDAPPEMLPAPAIDNASLRAKLEKIISQKLNSNSQSRDSLTKKLISPEVRSQLTDLMLSAPESDEIFAQEVDRILSGDSDS